MAITKILSKNMRLDKLIRYIQNPDKTEESVLTFCQFCNPKDAARQWAETKRHIGKTDGIQAFHIIQSFYTREFNGYMSRFQCIIFHRSSLFFRYCGGVPSPSERLI